MGHQLLWQAGVKGFHRAELLNLTWGELSLCFNAVDDMQFTGKRRYNGPVISELVRAIQSIAQCSTVHDSVYLCRSSIRMADMAPFVPTLRVCSHSPRAALF